MSSLAFLFLLYLYKVSKNFINSISEPISFFFNFEKRLSIDIFIVSLICRLVIMGKFLIFSKFFILNKFL